jgi:hypothetical protein
MIVEQISVFLENKAGRLFEVTGILSEAKVNIRALSLADTSDFGVLRLIVSDNEETMAALKENGFTVGKTQVVAVEVQDQPGGLHTILKYLKEANINVEYMYSYLRHSGDNAVMIFRFDNITAALSMLQEKGIAIVGDKDLDQGN